MNYNVFDLQDTIVALATPEGKGAIAVIRISGKEAITIADIIFKGKNLSKQASHTIHFGNIVNVESAIIDEVLVSLFVSPHSYTKENVVEISCHGSPFIIKSIIELIVSKGVRLARPGEFTLRAYLNGGLDLSQAEAVADLIASDSKSSHELALKHLKSGFSTELQGLRTELVHFASLIELELDFGEEDVEFAKREDLKILVLKIMQHIDLLIKSFALGNVIKNGVATVIAGRPNAGKSTLLNQLLNQDRAIVSNIAGTTRDTIEEILYLNGIAFRLIDTAGIRSQTEDTIEKIGIQKTLEQIQLAEILVYIFDVATLTISEIISDILKYHLSDIKIIIIGNKIDLISEAEKTNWLEGLKHLNDHGVQYNFVGISAKNNENIDTIKSMLSKIIDTENIQNRSIISNTRHLEALNSANIYLQKVIDGIDNGTTNDFIAIDIRRAIDNIGSITGNVDVEDLLENIFSKFCIGK
jgi:tRNA modification GTPase